MSNITEHHRQLVVIWVTYALHIHMRCAYVHTQPFEIDSLYKSISQYGRKMLGIAGRVGVEK